MIEEAAGIATSARGRFTIALSGGDTPRILYNILATEFADRLPWATTHVFFGDERCVPPDHPESNYAMASATLLSKVPIAPEKIHRMRGEIDPNEAAKEYGLLLKKNFPDGRGIDL